MMKKVKGVAVVEGFPYPIYEDPRIRYKHQSLMQDYQELENVFSFNGFSLFS